MSSIFDVIRGKGREVTLEKPDEEAVAWVLDRLKEAVRDKKAFETRALKSIAHYRGEQYTESSEHLGELYQLELDPDETAYVGNHIVQHVETMVARFLGGVPRMTPQPTSPDPEARLAAKAAARFPEYIVETTGMERDYDRVARWVVTTGVCWYRLFLERGEPMLFKDGSEGVQPRVGITYRNPFAVTVPLGYERVEDLPVLFDEEVMAVDEARRRWPEVADKIEGGMRRFREIAPQLAGLDATVAASFGGDKDQERVAITEAWVRPQGPEGLFPEGAVVTLAGEEVLEWRGLLPVWRERLPYFAIQDIPVPGTLYAESRVHQMIAPQQVRNRAVSLKVDHMERFRAKVFAPAGSVSQEAMDDSAGEIVEFNPSFGPPVMSQPPPLNADNNLVISIAQDDMQRLANNAPVSEGASAGAIQSGAGHLVLQQADKWRNLPSAARLAKDVFEPLFTMALKIAQEEMPPEVQAMVVGRTRQPELVQLSRESLRKVASFKMQPDALLPDNPMVRAQHVQMLMQMQLLSPRAAAQMLDLSVAFDDVLADVNADAENATRQIVEFEETGELRQARRSDNHPVYIEAFLKFVRSARFERLDKEMQMLAEVRLRQHELYAHKQQLAAMAQQLAAQGAAPEVVQQVVGMLQEASSQADIPSFEQARGAMAQSGQGQQPQPDAGKAMVAPIAAATRPT